MKNNILVTGGNGFIGTQIVHELHECGHTVTTVDRKIKHWDVPGTIYEEDFVTFLTQYEISYDTIIHLAADHEVERSVTEPSEYYTNNVIKTKMLLDIMVNRGIKNIIFSSTGSVYGDHGNGPLQEGLSYNPENPYASTKVVGELLIKDYARAYGINYINFRYFNAVGADPKCRFGYVQRPATHVIPILCNKILKGETFKVFGNDYDTKDGTCIRDYVHVADLAKAHSMGIEFINSNNVNYTFNLGDGIGTSVKEIIHYASKVTGKEPHIEYVERRPGDPAILFADTSLANDMLGWKPKYDIQQSILHAWKWENKYEDILNGRK